MDSAKGFLIGILAIGMLIVPGPGSFAAQEAPEEVAPDALAPGEFETLLEGLSDEERSAMEQAYRDVAEAAVVETPTGAEGPEAGLYGALETALPAGVSAEGQGGPGGEGAATELTPGEREWMGAMEDRVGQLQREGLSQEAIREAVDQEYGERFREAIEQRSGEFEQEGRPEMEGLEFERPGMEFERPGMEFEQPEVEFERPGMELERPEIEFERPEIEFEQPEIERPEMEQPEIEAPQFEGPEGPEAPEGPGGGNPGDF